MKVIDLLNHIANNGVDGEIRHIKYYNRNDDENDICMLCYENLIYKLNNGSLDLNDEVEIIKENKKIEKIDLSEWAEITYQENWEMLTKDFNRNCNLFVNKINEIIKAINEMREDK